MSRKTKASKRKKKQQQPVRRIPNWVYPTVLIGLIVGCFLLRTLPGWDKVFVDDLVLFRGTDPWYHMRLVDNMMVNFPWPLEWDMVALFPEGMNVGYFPLLSWMIAIPGQIFNYEVVGALLPPILGALTLIPIYFICKILWKDWVGLVACTFAMILPTEFFHRSLVGFTDHHILEIFFMACTILFLILIQKDNRLRWKILGGVSLGLYLSSWIGGLLLVLPIWLWFFGTFLYKHRKHEEVRPFCMDLFIVLGLGFLIYLPNIFFIKGTPPFALAAGVIAISPIVLYCLSKVLNWKVILGAVIGIVTISIIGAYSAYPDLMEFPRAVLMNPKTTIQEAMLSYPHVLLTCYGISFLLFIGGLIFAIKNKQNTLLVVWCAFMFFLMIGQRRWGYYFAISNGILVGYFIYLIASWMHQSVRIAVVSVILIILVITSGASMMSIARTSNYIVGDWYNTCAWLRENTPEIEGYYELNAEEPSYGILHWWDYGNWITRIARRSPVSNPMAQTPSTQWQVFLAHSEEEAEYYLLGIDYIIVSLDELTNKFHAIVNLSHYDSITWEPFIITLWEEEDLKGWTKIHQEGDIKVYGRI